MNSIDYQKQHKGKQKKLSIEGRKGTRLVKEGTFKSLIPDESQHRNQFDHRQMTSYKDYRKQLQKNLRMN
jgi:hypothetical protein